MPVTASPDPASAPGPLRSALLAPLARRALVGGQVEWFDRIAGHVRVSAGTARRVMQARRKAGRGWEEDLAVAGRLIGAGRPPTRGAMQAVLQKVAGADGMCRVAGEDRRWGLLVGLIASEATPRWLLHDVYDLCRSERASVRADRAPFRFQMTDYGAKRLVRRLVCHPNADEALLVRFARDLNRPGDVDPSLRSAFEGLGRGEGPLGNRMACRLLVEEGELYQAEAVARHGHADWRRPAFRRLTREAPAWATRALATDRPDVERGSLLAVLTASDLAPLLRSQHDPIREAGLRAMGARAGEGTDPVGVARGR